MKMTFDQRFPLLFQFFVGYFPDADLLGQTDQDVIKQAMKDYNEQELDQLLGSLKDLNSNISDWWRELSVEANRYFKTPEDATKWLEFVKSELEKGIESK